MIAIFLIFIGNNLRKQKELFIKLCKKAFVK
jgi:hypothetical protein